MRFNVFLSYALFLISTFAKAECLPAKTFIATDYLGGAFLRVNPKGNKVIFTDTATRSTQARTVLLEIAEQEDRNKQIINSIKTPFNDETYPVDTLSDEWTLIASPNHDGKMRYYELAEIQKNGFNAKPIYEDYENDYYHSTAELKGSQNNRKLVRTLLWKNQNYAEYEYIKGNQSKSSSMKLLRRGRICQNIVMENLSPDERNEEAKNRTLMDELSNQLKLKIFNLTSQGKTVDLEKDQSVKKIVDQMKKIKINDNVKNFDQPILNKTGDKVAAVVGTTLKVFQINEDKSCQEIKNLGTYSSKVRFSYPTSNGEELVSYKKKIFEGNTLVDRIVIFNMKSGLETVVPSDVPVSSFIEFTKEGRIFFYSEPKDGPKGYWLMDLNQISSNGQIKTDDATCIKRSEINSRLPKKKAGSGAR